MFLLLTIYHITFFGKLLGPHQDALDFDLYRVAMVFLGLHWDRVQGIFLQNPFFLLALVGVIPLFRADWRVGLCWLLLYLSLVSRIVIVTGLFPPAKGGGSLSQRFRPPLTPLAYDPNFEFRGYYAGKGELTLDKIEFKLAPAGKAWAHSAPVIAAPNP